MWPRDMCASGEHNCQGSCRARVDLTSVQLREWRERHEREQRLAALADPTHEPSASREELDEFVRAGGSVEEVHASLWRTRGSHGTHECTCERGYELNADGYRCDNINECAALNGNCSQKCTDQPGARAHEAAALFQSRSCSCSLSESCLIRVRLGTLTGPNLRLTFILRLC